jgi:hypothetical protein
MNKASVSSKIHYWSRWISADGKRWFIIVGKWYKGYTCETYEVLEPDKEQVKQIPASVWEQQIQDGNIARIV